MQLREVSHPRAERLCWRLVYTNDDDGGSDSGSNDGDDDGGLIKVYFNYN